MVYCGSDCGGGGCHCGARGGHRHLLPEGPLPGEGVHTQKKNKPHCVGQGRLLETGPDPPGK